MTWVRGYAPRAWTTLTSDLDDGQAEAIGSDKCVARFERDVEELDRQDQDRKNEADVAGQHIEELHDSELRWIANVSYLTHRRMKLAPTLPYEAILGSQTDKPIPQHNTQQDALIDLGGRRVPLVLQNDAVAGHGSRSVGVRRRAGEGTGNRG